MSTDKVCRSSGCAYAIDKWLLVVIALLLGGTIIAAPTTNPTQITLWFVPVWNNQPISTDIFYHMPSGDSLRFENIRFYVSEVAFLSGTEVVFSEPNSFHLIDINDTTSLQFNITQVPNDITALSFAIGIDSLTNVSGAIGGDLDPTKGMYWTWQSGYINAKIEGVSNACPTRKHQFQFHIGGYLPPFQAIQRINLPLQNTDTTLKIGINIEHFFDFIDLKIQHSIMIPGAEAQRLSYYFAKAFLVLSR